METIKLTKEHLTKLLEMCAKLFPELGSAQLGVKEEHGWSNDYLVFGIEKPDNETFVIHWFEFCVTKIFPKVNQWYNHHQLSNFLYQTIGHDKKKKPNKLNKFQHPIDYLYEEFELHKNKTKISK